MRSRERERGSSRVSQQPGEAWCWLRVKEVSCWMPRQAVASRSGDCVLHWRIHTAGRQTPVRRSPGTRKRHDDGVGWPAVVPARASRSDRCRAGLRPAGRSSPLRRSGDKRGTRRRNGRRTVPRHDGWCSSTALLGRPGRSMARRRPQGTSQNCRKRVDSRAGRGGGQRCSVPAAVPSNWFNSTK